MNKKRFYRILSTVLLCLTLFIFYGVSSAVTCPDNVSDGSFESGTPNPYWTEFSDNYGTPLCFDCGTFFPRTGLWYAWFGGFAGAETSSLSQSVVIPAGAPQFLRFYLWIGDSSGNGTDYFKVKIDGAEVFSVLEDNAAYQADYTLVSIDVSAYADGNSHLLSLESVESGPSVSSFLVDDISINCEVLLPSVTTAAATGVSNTAATLNGVVIANNWSTDVTFEYGTSQSYGNQVAATPGTVTGSSLTPVTASLPGLLPDTTYHYRVKGTFASGSVTGSDMTFTTVAANPCPENVLDGSFEAGSPGNPYWAETGIQLLCDYATCRYYGSRTGQWFVWFGGVSNAVVSGSVSQSITIPSGGPQFLKFYLWINAASGSGTDFFRATIDGTEVFSIIESNTAYQGGYTLVTIDVSAYADDTSHLLVFEATTNGPQITNFFLDDVSIDCNMPAPYSTTLAATGVSTTSATLNGLINANNSSASVTFEYGTTVAYGSTAAGTPGPVAGTTDTAVSAPLTGLLPNTTYHYRVVGVNAGGTANGGDMTFTTISVGDVNSDGFVNIVDALFVARHVAGLSVSSFDTTAADVDCNGNINIVDALFIARKVAGLAVPLWCGN